MKKITDSCILAAFIMAQACSTSFETDRIGVVVSPEENREYSYTDKKAGYWYGFTHQDGTEWYSGWNMAKKRILADYTTGIVANGGDELTLKRKDADNCTVYPDRIERSWNDVRERFQMMDNIPLLLIELESEADSIFCIPDMNHIAESEMSEYGLFLTPKEASDKLILLAPAGNHRSSRYKEGIMTGADAGGFIMAFGTRDECLNLVDDFRSNGESMKRERKERINSLITEYNPVRTNLPSLDSALNWITVTMDQLITEQQGKGIYAGLPWFNEYWGRDMFISMPGACLVTGQFETAKQILKDFALLQDKDPDSETYGRIPNRANLEGILYNTTDGTPRFVIQALEVARYSGDIDFLHDLYPAIKTSIDASIRNYTDTNGYLTHADADTWMDVKRNGIPGSPRGNRANDIQALWYGQLTAGSEIARLMGDEGSAEEWSGLALLLASNFERDFCDKDNHSIFDHLNADGTPDRQFRPNQLYCFELVNDDEFKQKVTRRTWEELVYPWGTASLAQWDKQFHPQHENWHYYHKDDAYHNGTIWLWNNGIAMQRMLEYGQTAPAWELFKNMNRQALNEGAVGSLSENADAHPRAGKNWVKRSGTFLQAWSNAEHLRVWYQHFLGIRPDLLSGKIVIEPNIPDEVTDIETAVKVGNGKLHYSYHKGKVSVRLEGCKAEIEMREPAAEVDSKIFEGISFCMPDPLESYPCFNTYHEEALTY